MVEILGYLGALIIGISLGLIGGGGSILTVPLLVYLMGVSPVLATAYSLFIVGSSSLVGGIQYALKGLVDFKTTILFGIPSIIAVYTTRRFLVPAIPETVYTLGDFELSRDMILMLLFAILMIVASVSMIRKKSDEKESKLPMAGWITASVVLGEGLTVGTLTGLVGAGGGFLIIPALVLFAGLKMKEAIGTSLIIISAKSLIGFLGDVSNYSMDWGFLITFSFLAIIGIFLGSYISTKIDGPKLKVAFGWFVLIMGIFILFKELI
ncbi:MAG: sulfite exporter TauE/SafE family protein [Cryomorphaceae bacterium]